MKDAIIGSKASRQQFKVLVVEDEWLIAIDVVQAVLELGYAVAGSAPDCATALDLIASEMPDVVLIDTQLGTQSCEPVLKACRARGIPVVITSGHTAAALPAYCVGLPYLAKPVQYDRLAAMLALIETSRVES